MLCRAVQGAAAEGGRWRKERAHLRLKWPPSSTYLIPSPTDLQQCSCSFHPWMNWVESTACWKVDGDFFSHPQKKITSHSLMLSGDLCVCRILRWVHHFFFFPLHSWLHHYGECEQNVCLSLYSHCGQPSPTITDRPARFETRYLDLECKCFVQEEEGSARSLKATSFWLMSFEMALQEQ